jgi:hypothetical protein
MSLKTAEFDADFESVEKLQTSSCGKRYHWKSDEK